MECLHNPVTRQAVRHIPPEPKVLRAEGNPTACVRRLLTIHAHPDDESSKGGGSAARYAAAGVGTVLVCCTGGEAGTIHNPALNHPEVQARLAEVRRAELLEETTHLGYQRVWMLGYRDSDIPASGAPGTFAATRHLDVHFVSPAPVERHARVGGHPVPMALISWIPAFAGMTRGHKHWQCIYEMDI